MCRDDDGGRQERYDGYGLSNSLPCADKDKLSIPLFWWLEFIITICFSLDYVIRFYAAPVRILSIDWNKLQETVGSLFPPSLPSFFLLSFLPSFFLLSFLSSFLPSFLPSSLPCLFLTLMPGPNVPH